jgi:hypothetical protein
MGLVFSHAMRLGEHHEGRELRKSEQVFEHIFLRFSRVPLKFFPFSLVTG